MRQTGKINYLEIPSQDLDKTKAFFSHVFGWNFVDYGPDYMAIEDAGIDGGFYRSPLYSEALESTLEQVKAAGGEIVKDIFSFPGGRRFHFTDPNGNEYAVWSE